MPSTVFAQLRRVFPASLLAAAALLIAPALQARPADCLVVVEGKTLLDGACDFRPDGSDGSFTIAGKGVSASVMVFKDGGMATYTSAGQPWKLGDVRRDGACWVNRLGKVCSWAAGTRPAAAKPAAAAQRGQPVEGKLFRWEYGKAGAWEIARFSSDPYGKTPSHCTAIVITGSEQALRIAAYPKTTVYAYMGDASAALGDAPRIAYWFDNRKNDRIAVTGKLITSQEERVEWLTFTGPPDLDSRLIKATSLHFGYRWEGKDLVQSFALKNVGAALEKLYACAGR